MALMEDFKRHGDFLFRYRSFFPIPFLLIGFGVFIFSQLETKGLITPEYYFVISFATSLIGLLIRIIVVGYAPKNTSGRNTKNQRAEVLNTTGMYSIVRHPLYVGNFLMWLGIALLIKNIWFILIFILVYWLYYERIMYAEEAFLRNKFGKDYLKWADSVPSFIPNFLNWKSPNEFFSLKNVLRREYTGLFKLILIFFVFHYAHSVIQAGNNFYYLGDIEKIWLGLFVFGLFFYLTIRLLHKKTKLLDVEGR